MRFQSDSSYMWGSISRGLRQSPRWIWLWYSVKSFEIMSEQTTLSKLWFTRLSIEISILVRLQEFLYLFGTITREMGVSCVSIPSFICWLHCIVRLFNSAYKVNQSPQMNLYKHINISFFPLGMKFIYIRTQLVLLQKKKEMHHFAFWYISVNSAHVCYTFANLHGPESELTIFLFTFCELGNSVSQIFIWSFNQKYW